MEKTRWPRALALHVARDILTWLKPLCAEIMVVGSLRRRKAEVGDIEFLYVSRFLEWPDEADIFKRLVPTNVTDHALGLQRDLGVLRKRMKENGTPIGWGEDNKYAVHTESGVPVDFFQATRETWWNNLVCRTGGALSNTSIAAAAQDRGWKWNSTKEGFTRVSGPDRGRIHPVRSEQDVFAFVGMEYLAPEARL